MKTKKVIEPHTAEAGPELDLAVGPSVEQALVFSRETLIKSACNTLFNPETIETGLLDFLFKFCSESDGRLDLNKLFKSHDFGPSKRQLFMNMIRGDRRYRILDTKVGLFAGKIGE